MSDKVTLLACPFCGSEYTQVRWIGFKYRNNGAFTAGFRGECTECYAITRAFRTETEAIVAWNNRDKSACVTCNPRDSGRCLEGTDCPAWICSECGELFEAGANFCSNCGAKVERK